MKKSYFLFLSLLFCSFYFLGCQKIELPEDVPTCLKRKIREKKPIEVWKYQYNQQTVYLFIPDCCDQFINLYDANCNLLCSPSGGFTGKGDGKCPDFHSTASQEVLIWEAPK